MTSRLNEFHVIYKNHLEPKIQNCELYFDSIIIYSPSKRMLFLSWKIYEICICHSLSIVQVIATNVISKVNATNIIKVQPNLDAHMDIQLRHELRVLSNL